MEPEHGGRATVSMIYFGGYLWWPKHSKYCPFSGASVKHPAAVTIDYPAGLLTYQLNLLQSRRQLDLSPFLFHQGGTRRRGW